MNEETAYGLQLIAAAALILFCVWRRWAFKRSDRRNQKRASQIRREFAAMNLRSMN